MNGFVFLRPQFLWLLGPFLTFTVFFFRARRNASIWENICSKTLLPYILDKKKTKRSFSYLLFSAIGVLMIVALAGPSWESAVVPVSQSQSGLVVLLDLSKVMDAEDMKPSRLQRAIYKLVDILALRKEGQTALIVYSGDPFVVTPLTDDTETIKALLPALDTSIMPSQGHQTDKAIVKAGELFNQAGISERAILLITPELSKTELAGSINAASSINASVYVLGVGTKEGTPLPSSGGGFLKDESGAVFLSALNEDNLNDLAVSTNGRYAAMKTDDKDLKTLAKAIAPSHITQERESNEAMLQKRMDQGYWIVLLVLPLVLLLFRRGILLAVVLLFMPHTAQAFSWDQWWETPDQKGERLFHEENYSEAREQFQNDDWQGAASYRMGDYNDSAQSFKQNQTAEGLYNYGTAKAKSGDLEEALEAYQRTLELDPTHEDALYNKELIEELKKEQEKQEQSQEGEKQQESESQEQKSKEKNNSQQEQQQDSNKEQTEDQQEQKGGSKPNDEETSEEERSSNQSNQQSDDRDEVQEEHKHSDLDPKEERELNEQFQSEMEQELEKREEQSQEPSEQATEEMEDVEALQRKIDDKWLDKVEDDPGGLLRRKFLLQYRQKKR